MALPEDAPDRYPADALDVERLAPEILDRIQDGFYAIDRHWRVVCANRRACEMCGKAREAILGRVLWECFPQLSNTATGAQLRDAVEAGVAAEFETVSPIVGRWLWVRVDPLRPGMTGVYLRDITDRKRAEEALRESEERFRRVFEQSPLGKATAGPDFRFREVNPALCAMLGYTADELVGMSFLDIVHPADRDTCLRHGTAMMSGEIAHVQLEERFLQKSGGPIWVSINVGPIRDAEGNILYSLGIIENIDERKRIEVEMRRLAEELEEHVAARTRELAEANDRLLGERLLSELIVENTTEGVIVVDNDMRYLLWNVGMEDISGLMRSEVLGKTVFEVFPHLVDHPVGQAWRDALAGRRTALRARRYSAPRRGVEIVYDADHAPLYDQARAIIGAVCIVRDTTERHRIEEMLRQSQKMEAVAQLTGGVAHDFNNLLTAVVGCLDLISAEVKDKRLRRLAQIALRSADRGARLTHQLLSYARQQELKSVTADLNDMLRGMEMLLRRAAGETIEMVIDCAPGLWRCEVDPAQFEVAVMNLVMNARDAMPAGGRLVVSIENLEAVDIPAGVDLPSAEYVAFAVRDTGAGMTPKVRARALEPFFTTKETGSGSGLGLSMVYGFAKQSGGGLQLESEPGAGTCVTIYLPRARSPVDGAGANGALAQPGSASILVVEDDAEVREVTLATLESLGYRASVVGNGPEALAVLRRDGGIDLLFTDIVMPLGMSGVELARRAVAIRPGLKVLLTTGYAGPQTSASGEFPMLPKPFRPTELGRALAGLICPPNRDQAINAAYDARPDR
jgi:PAS domain S-box-containing protein